MATFKKELPAFNSNVVMYVECFQLEDQSSCQIAQRYYLLFADYWTVKPITANCHEQHPEKVGLKGRIWLTTQKISSTKGRRKPLICTRLSPMSK